MLNYLLTSTFIHAAILLSLLYTPGCIKSGATAAGKIQVNIVQKHKFYEQAPILPTLRKPLILGNGGGKVGKVQKVDMKSYANRLKAAVDPIWYSHVHPLEAHLLKKYTTIVLLFPDKHGNIRSMRIVKGSGDAMLDAMAIQTFREVGQIPIPPESLIKEGIEWDFSVGRK